MKPKKADGSDHISALQELARSVGIIDVSIVEHKRPQGAKSVQQIKERFKSLKTLRSVVPGTESWDLGVDDTKTATDQEKEEFEKLCLLEGITSQGIVEAEAEAEAEEAKEAEAEAEAAAKAKAKAKEAEAEAEAAAAAKAKAEAEAEQVQQDLETLNLGEF